MVMIFAFDKFWFEGLILKVKQFGITEILLKWFIDYLSDRKQRVVIEGQYSEWTSRIIPYYRPVHSEKRF